MSKTYFGFAVADSMFSDERMLIARKVLTAEQAVKMIRAGGVIPCLNPSHQATIAAMRSRFGIDLQVPEKPPQVTLGIGDWLIVMGVRGLPRLTDRHEYTEDEVAKATFVFTAYYIVADQFGEIDALCTW